MDAGEGDEHPDSDVEMPHLLEELDDSAEPQNDGGEEEDEDDDAETRELDAHYDEEAEEHHDEEEGVEDEERDVHDYEGGEEEMEEEEESGNALDENNVHEGEEPVEDEEAAEEEHEDGAPHGEEVCSDEEDQSLMPAMDKAEDDDSTVNNNNQDLAKRKRSASHSSVDEEGPRRKQVRSASVSGQKHDAYCWVCHKDGIQAVCKICPRSYHLKCMHSSEDSGKAQQSESPTKTCICPECAIVMNAENLETRSDTMKNLTIDQLITMLKYACQRMKSTAGAEPFFYPVNPEEAVDYFHYVVYPMDLATLENNVKKREYGSTEAFLADAQWLVHNSVVFNSANSPFTAAARKILKVCRQEIEDIETCPECYVNAHDKPEVWFVEACPRPHILVWAKLKGFPFWPAKAMKMKDDLVDVRFFGAHDRAWVIAKYCYLYSEQHPGVPPKKNAALTTSLTELNAHVENLKKKHGTVVFGESKIPVGPRLSLEEIRQMLPEYKPDDPPVSKTSGGITPQSPKKSPMTIRISSLKTNPTIVTNSVIEDGMTEKPKLRLKTASDGKDDKQGPVSENEFVEEEETDHLEEEQGQSSADESGAHPSTTKKPQPKPSGGILATALAGRPTRRSSRSETGSTSPSSAAPGEQRLLRAVLKQDKSESGGEDGPRDATPPPPKSFLSSLGLMKSSDVVKTKKPMGGTSQLGKLLHPSEVFVKQEQDEEEDEDYGDISGGHSRKLNEPTNQGGMRFNLSKDISISPVGDDSGEGHSQQQQPRRLIQGHNARLVPGLIPQNAQMMGGGMRPRQLMNTNGGGMQQRIQQQHSRGMMRPRQGAPMRPGMMRMNGPPRPQSMQMMQAMKQQLGQKAKDVSSNMMIDSSSLQAQGAFTNAVQLNQVHSIQGAVTLPGGTITVTPLQPLIGLPITDGGMNGGQMVLKQSLTSSNGLPISVLTPHDGGGAQSLLKSNNKPNPQRRNLMNQVPPAVGHLVQNLQKTLVENVKTTMEQIVVEMIEKANSSGGGPEVKAIKDENERLKKQLAEYKHNHDSTREVKEAMIADKKRALTELRKQCEQEKNKAVEETKKRQWCAGCGREAQFYCCWNTSYCGYSCQEEHWPSHMNSCSQSSGGGRQ